MTDVKVPPEMAQDPQGASDPEYSRDPAPRTPMQWSVGVNAGFCPDDVDPWLPVADDSTEVNVEMQKEDPFSMLSLCKRLIHLRTEQPALTMGSYRPLDTGDNSVLTYLREHGEHRLLVALNFSAGHRILDLSETGKQGEVLCSTRPDQTGQVDLRELYLQPDEGLMLSLESET